MIKIAVYGKGGIGKSTTVSNVAAALAEKGLTVMQIGCDPKADSTIQLRHGKQMWTVLDLYNEKKQNLKLEDMTTTGYQGVICLGDVVCGGFTMPMRKGYADKVFIITSGENMAIHAGANIAMAVQNFKNRGYAALGGIILNRRNVKREEEKVQELADDFETQIIGKLTRSDLVTDAEEQGKTLMECYPDSEMAAEYRTLAENILAICRKDGLC